MTADEVDEAAVQVVREFLVPYTTHTQELARKIVAGLRHAHLLRAGVIKYERPPITFDPNPV